MKGHVATHKQEINMKCGNNINSETKKTNALLLSKMCDTKSASQFIPSWPLPYNNKLKRDLSLHYSDKANKEKLERTDALYREGKDIGGEKDSIKVYFKEIKDYPLISSEEEAKLARRIAKGDKKARRKMVEANLRLVINIAKHYMHRGLPLHDLIEEGNIGLIQAVEHFKASKGCKFSTYATFWIKQAIERAIINQANVVRVPIHVTADISRLMRVSRELTTVLKKQPDILELSEKTGFSGRYIKKLTTIINKNYSLDSAIHKDSDQSLLDLIEDNTVPQPVELINQSMRTEKINSWLRMLDDRENTIIRRRFGFVDDEPQTLQHIGKSIGVSRERIRQIERNALIKLKDIAAQSDIESLEAI